MIVDLILEPMLPPWNLVDVYGKLFLLFKPVDCPARQFNSRFDLLTVEEFTLLGLHRCTELLNGAERATARERSIEYGSMLQNLGLGLVVLKEGNGPLFPNKPAAGF
jgi:hypothetical protein